MKILIIGGSGRLGKFVVSELKKKVGHEIKIFDLTEPKTDKYQFFKENIKDLKVLKELGYEPKFN
jgi:nucleoside-diphosphate-sugar epimerase